MWGQLTADNCGQGFVEVENAVNAPKVCSKLSKFGKTLTTKFCFDARMKGDCQMLTITKKRVEVSDPTKLS